MGSVFIVVRRGQKIVEFCRILFSADFSRKVNFLVLGENQFFFYQFSVFFFSHENVLLAAGNVALA